MTGLSATTGRWDVITFGGFLGALAFVNPILDWVLRD